MGLAFPKQQQLKLTELMTQIKMKKNRANSLINDDISPKNYLLDRMSEDDNYNAFFEEHIPECECELQEAERTWRKRKDATKSNQVYLLQNTKEVNLGSISSADIVFLEG